MVTTDPEEKKTLKQLTIRDIPYEDFAALERMRRRLRLPMERFGRLLLHLAAWEAPAIFERALRDALGAEWPSDEDFSEDEI